MNKQTNQRIPVLTVIKKRIADSEQGWGLMRFELLV